MGRICRLIEQHLDDAEPPTLARLSASAGVGPHHLQRTFKRLVGLSPREWAEARRLERLKARLKDGRGVTEAGYEAGYGSAGRLYERASGPLGMPPGTYRRGAKDVSLIYTVTDSPLGRLLVAATDRGVSAVYLGDADGPLEAALREEYPAAERRRDDAGLAPTVQAILAHLEGRLPRLDLPVDVKAFGVSGHAHYLARTMKLTATAISRPRASCSSTIARETPVARTPSFTMSMNR